MARLLEHAAARARPPARAQMKEESDAVGALRRASEDARKHHSHITAQLAHHVQHAGNMWGEARARAHAPPRQMPACVG